MTPEEKKEKKKLYDKLYNEKNKELNKIRKKLTREKQDERNEKVKQKRAERNEDEKRLDSEKRKERNDNLSIETKEKYKLKAEIRHKIYRNDESVKKGRAIYNKEYKKKNSEKLKLYTKNWHKNKLETDNVYKAKIKTRAMIKDAMRRMNYSKNASATQILGCSFIDFKTYLELKFEDWMTWDNYGLYNGAPKYGWDIDHIIALSKGKTIEEVHVLNHHTNLQPLCSYYNRDVKRES